MNWPIYTNAGKLPAISIDVTAKWESPKLKPGDLCQVRQKVFVGKHKIGDHWENTKYEVIEHPPNLQVYTNKPCKEEGWAWVVHRNLLMNIVHPHKQDKTKSEPDDSKYDTPPWHIGLSDPVPHGTGPVTWSQTRAHQLAQSIWETWTKAIHYIQHK